MGDHFRPYFQNLKSGLKKLPKKEKKNIVLAISVSIFIMGVFFYTPERKVSLAKSTDPKKFTSLDKLAPKKNLGTFVYKNSEERNRPTGKTSLSTTQEPESSNLGRQKIMAPVAGQLVEKMFPEKKIGTYVYKNQKKWAKNIATRCDNSTGKILTKNANNSAYAMVAGHPIEEMLPYIEKRNKRVASFLVAIAKKESDWGIYSPKKSGRECYNYWGYKGTYNLTESGYSCFDSPEQAVKEVGDRIENLLNKEINTAEKMVVWKCGRSCAGHDPAGVAKWISDVALYYGKLNS